MGGILFFFAVHEPYFKNQKEICEPLGSRKTNNNKLIYTCCSYNN